MKSAKMYRRYKKISKSLDLDVDEFENYMGIFYDVKEVLETKIGYLSWVLEIESFEGNKILFTYRRNKLVAIEIRIVTVISVLEAYFDNTKKEFIDSCINNYIESIRNSKEVKKLGIEMCIKKSEYEGIKNQNSPNELNIELVKNDGISDEEFKKVMTVTEDYFYEDSWSRCQQFGMFLDTVRLTENNSTIKGMTKFLCILNDSGSVSCSIDNVSIEDTVVYGDSNLNLPIRVEIRYKNKITVLGEGEIRSINDGYIGCLAVNSEDITKKDIKILEQNLEHIGKIEICYYKGSRVKVILRSGQTRTTYVYHNGKVDVEATVEGYEVFNESIEELMKDVKKKEEIVDAEYSYITNGTDSYCIRYTIENLKNSEVEQLQRLHKHISRNEFENIDNVLKTHMELGRDKYTRLLTEEVNKKLQETLEKFS